MFLVDFIRYWNFIFLFLFQIEVNFGKDIVDNSWYFVVFIVDVNVVQFYVDGDLVGNVQ